MPSTMRVAAIVTVLLSGCGSEAVPFDQALVLEPGAQLPDLPLRVWVSPAFSDEHREAVEAGAAWWNEQLPGVVASVGVSERPACGDKPCCGVTVSYANLPVETARGAVKYHDGCQVELLLDPATIEDDDAQAIDGFVTRLVVHELAHVLLGPEHSEDPDNVLADSLTASSVSDEQVAMMRERWGR